LLNPDWRTTAKLKLEIADDTLPSDIPPAMRQMLLTHFA
jgi:hypothetical protein